MVDSIPLPHTLCMLCGTWASQDLRSWFICAHATGRGQLSDDDSRLQRFVVMFALLLQCLKMAT